MIQSVVRMGSVGSMKARSRRINGIICVMSSSPLAMMLPVEEITGVVWRRLKPIAVLGKIRRGLWCISNWLDVKQTGIRVPICKCVNIYGEWVIDVNGLFRKHFSYQCNKSYPLEYLTLHVKHKLGFVRECGVHTNAARTSTSFEAYLVMKTTERYAALCCLTTVLLQICKPLGSGSW